MKGIAALQKFAARSVIKRFAAKHGLVYFGGVNANDDEHQLVRGVTAHATHTDSNYTVGTFDGHDLIIVERHNHTEHPGLPSVNHSWLILQVDLKQGGLPHVFIDSHHDEAFHSNLRIGHTKLRDVTNLVPSFNGATVVAPPSELKLVSDILSADFIETASKFGHFDYEMNNDQLFVYAHNTRASEPVLTDMLRIGIWLAGYLESLLASDEQK